MTDNEKATIAAGLWEPCYDDGTFCSSHPSNTAPDMHLPENLWRALEQLTLCMLGKNPTTGNWVCSFVCPGRSRHTHIERARKCDAVFSALVALYDAEHKNESAIA